MAQTILNIPIRIEFNPYPSKWKLKTTSTGLRYFQGNAISRLTRISADSSAVLHEFLGLKDEADLEAFLNKTGLFTTIPDTFSDLSNWQMLIRKLLTGTPTTWKKLEGSFPSHMTKLVRHNNNFPIFFDWEAGHHSGVILTGTTLKAILATIHVIHLRGAKFRFCARADCGQAYEVTSKHQRKYCREYCAHIESVRRTRKKQRNERIATKTQK